MFTKSLSIASWIFHLTLIMSAIAIAQRASGTVIETTSRSIWESSVSSHTTLTFTDLAPWTLVTNQYAAQGVIVSNDNNFIHYSSSYPSDGVGLSTNDGFGNPGRVGITFLTPVDAIALDFIGWLRIDLYRQNQLLYSSNVFIGDFTPFVGLFSTESFDAAVIIDPDDPVVAIDNLYFGPPIPGPSALGLMALAALVWRSRYHRM